MYILNSLIGGDQIHSHGLLPNSFGRLAAGRANGSWHPLRAQMLSWCLAQEPGDASLPSHKAGLLSLFRQQGVVTHWGFICGLSGKGLLFSLGANPVGSSCLRGLAGTRQLALTRASPCFHLLLGDNWFRRRSVFAHGDSVGPLCNVNNVFCCFCFYNLFLGL